MAHSGSLYIRRALAGILAMALVGQSFPTPARAQGLVPAAPVTVISEGSLIVSPASSQVSPPDDLPILKGLVLDRQDPFQLAFLLHPADEGSAGLSRQPVRSERNSARLNEGARRLAGYFLASLAVPEQDTWVNLSAFEKERIVPPALGSTLLGQDMLAEDYLLKQLTASLTNPDTATGRAFWDKVYSAVQMQFGTTDVPVDLMNKVWIVPEKAEVFRQGNAVYVLEQKLKVLTAEDHGAKSSSAMYTGGHDAPPADNNERGFVSPSRLPTHQPTNPKATQVTNPPPYPTQAIATKILRDKIIPIIEHEVNTGAQFAALRQIYNAMILAAWYKKNLRRTILGEDFIDRSGVNGVQSLDQQAKERTYNAYLKAFTAGAYNLIREDKDPLTGDTVPRRYFSGGLQGVDPGQVKELSVLTPARRSAVMAVPGDMAAVVRLVQGQAADPASAHPDLAANDPSGKEEMTAGVRRETIERLFIELEQIHASFDNERTALGASNRMR
ncbi:MAG: hypothetical protein HQL20_08685, partial [Candidatus Omnitrophica bacterium]|nr:hypothetical protein [Candidatus Omnitrophota bacterium]